MTTSSIFGDKAAAKYAKDPVTDQAAYEHTLERTRSYLNADDVVLEIGAGTGSTAILLAPSVGRLIATDYSKNMIAQGMAKPEVAALTNLELVQADVFDPKLGEQKYDVILAHNVLHLLPDAETALSHLHGLLKPGGLLISKTACMGGDLPWKLRLMLLALPIAQWLGKAPYVSLFSVPELDSLIADAGFEVLETGIHPETPPHRYVVARAT